MGTDNQIYDAYANPYDKVQLRWDPYLALNAMHLGSVVAAWNVLDHGCGTGNQTIPLITADKTVDSIDRNETMLGFLYEKLERFKNIRYLLTTHNDDAEILRFDGESFDAVTSMNTVYNMDNPINAMHQVNRVLRPGGIFAVSGPLPNASGDILADNCIEEFKRKGIYDNEMAESIEVMRQMNNELLPDATKWTAHELENILTQEIKFERIAFSTEQHYYGTAYFVKAIK